VLMAIEPGNPNLPPGIEGSVDRPRQWILISQYNTDWFIFEYFIDQMLRNIETHPVTDNYDNERCLLWDNLSLHKTSHVTTIIRDCQKMTNFYSFDRPPYHPKIAPIEYIFMNWRLS